MPEVMKSIDIRRERQDVWDFLIDPQNSVLWQSNLHEFVMLSDGPARKGSTYRGTTKVAGRKVDWEAELIEFTMPESLVWRSTDSPMEWELEYDLFEGDGFTTMRYHITVPGFGGFFGKIGDAIVTRMYERDVASNLEHLKELLEA